MSPTASNTAARWQLRLLGGFALSDGQSHAQRLPSRATQLILARLALAPQRDHPREELIDLLWPEAEREVGRNRLRQALSELRSVLQPAGERASPLLLADRHVVRLAPGALASDVQALRQALAEADMAAAAQLYRGELLPGHFDDWVLEERRHLERDTSRLLARRALRPSPSEQPEQHERHDQPPTAPPLPSRHWLPAYLTRSLGYEEAAAALTAAVRAQRLVLLRGPGGAGKTRLAVQVARALAEGVLPDVDPALRFDAVVFVPLAGITSALGMAEAILKALRSEGAGTAADAAAQLETLLAGRRVLLVLDNFEQLVEAGRELLAHWLVQLPGLHLLVTSRRALGLDGEHEQALHALALPAPEATLAEQMSNPAVALFVDRARAARSSFQLGPRNHHQVAAVVRLLQGLPLAIELAAARVRSISLAQMQAMLEAALQGQPDAAFALLSRSGPRGGDDPRHASMLRVLEWSFLHLSPAARALLDVLCVCAGGATLQAAAAISGLALHEVATQLDELVASSVVYTSHGHDEAGDERTRCQPFEPVREYALHQLDVSAQAALRWRHWHWLQAWSAGLGSAPSLAAFGDEQNNLIAGWQFGVQQHQAAQVLASALHCARALDDVTLPPSTLALLGQCLASVGDDAELCARAHALLAEQCFESGQRDAASAHAEQSLRLMPDDSPHRAEALHAAVRMRLRIHDDVQTLDALIDAGLRLAAQHQRFDLQARLLALQAVLIVRRDRQFARSVELHTQALALWRSHGAPQRVTEGLVNLALSLGFVHRVPEQLALLQQAQRAAAAQGQQRLLAFAHSIGGYALADLGRWDESAASYRSCLQLAWAHSAWREWFYALWNLPRTLAHLRQPERAIALLAFADVFASERFGQLGRTDLRERRRSRRLVRALLGAEREASLWAQGRTLGMAEAMALALAPY
jgi:predicted ATPase